MDRVLMRLLTPCQADPVRPSGSVPAVPDARLGNAKAPPLGGEPRPLGELGDLSVQFDRLAALLDSRLMKSRQVAASLTGVLRDTALASPFAAVMAAIEKMDYAAASRLLVGVREQASPSSSTSSTDPTNPPNQAPLSPREAGPRQDAPRIPNDFECALQQIGGHLPLLLASLWLLRNEIPVDRQNIAQDVLARNAEAVGQRAHRLKGALGLLGRNRAFMAALALETAGRDGNVSRFENLHQELEETLEELLPRIDAFLDAPEAFLHDRPAP
jgi:HPt (histidine-containing phosphotransfer) domain-containing protein